MHGVSRALRPALPEHGDFYAHGAAAGGCAAALGDFATAGRSCGHGRATVDITVDTAVEGSGAPALHGLRPAAASRRRPGRWPEQRAVQLRPAAADVPAARADLWGSKEFTERFKLRPAPFWAIYYCCTTTPLELISLLTVFLVCIERLTDLGAATAPYRNNREPTRVCVLCRDSL